MLAEALKKVNLDPTALTPVTQPGWPETHAVQVPSAKAVQTWENLVEALKGTGYWPLILGNELNTVDPDLLEDAPSVEEIIAQAKTLNLQEALDERYKEATELLEDEDPEEAAEFLAERQVTADQITLDTPVNTLHTSFEQESDAVWIGIIKTEEPWHLPAHLHFGDWNDCPETAVVTAYVKAMQDQHQAKLMTITFDVIELALPAPIRDKQTLVQVATNAFAFAPDLVDQGTGTLPLLAEELAKTRTLYYWWD